MPLKSLIFSSLYPLPENIGTRMRTMNFVRFFKKSGEVDLAYQRTGIENLEGKGLFRKEFKVGMSAGETSGSREFTNRFRRLIERRPYVIAEWPRKAVEELRAIISRENYDFILCRYMQDCFPFLGLPPDVKRKVIIDMDDVFSTSLFETYAERKQGIYGGLKWRLQKELLLNFQKRCLTAGAVIFCSDDDRKDVAGPAGSPIAHLVPNTYPATLKIGMPDSSGFANRRILLFVGALDYGPNIAGLDWFLRSVFPNARNACNDLRLLIVGRQPSESLVRRLLDCPGIELHSDVSDVGPFYEKCGAVVVPLLSGGGTRIKILEAAMACRPVFSTPIGAYGLSPEVVSHLNLFEDDGSFMEKFRKMDDKERYRECVIKMHAAVQNTYSPEAFDRSMRRIVDGIREKSTDRSVSVR
jgi:glycosyltransferase involved in cell wall biosynthesis